MSRTLALLIAITLGFPVLAMVAIAATGGIKADFLLSFLTAAVLMAFAVGAIFEIRRIADLDHHASPEPDAVPAGPPQGAQAYEAAPTPERSPEIRVPEAPPVEAAEIVLPQRAVEELAPEAAVAPVVAKPKRKGGRRKGTTSAA
jgi:hypothetical protein